MELLVLTAEECRPLRAFALGEGEDSAVTAFDADEAEGALHLGLKEGDDLLAVASVLPERRDGDREMWRLRGVVVHPEHRGEGLGGKLVNAMITITGERGGGIWALCPEAAKGFLERCGMEAEGEPVAAGGGVGDGPDRVMVRPG